MKESDPTTALQRGSLPRHEIATCKRAALLYLHGMTDAQPILIQNVANSYLATVARMRKNGRSPLCNTQ